MIYQDDTNLYFPALEEKGTEWVFLKLSRSVSCSAYHYMLTKSLDAVLGPYVHTVFVSSVNQKTSGSALLKRAMLQQHGPGPAAHQAPKQSTDFLHMWSGIRMKTHLEEMLSSGNATLMAHMVSSKVQL